MASQFIGDIAIKVGSYTGSDGKEKGEYRRIGKLMEGDNGPFVLLNADVLTMPLFALANKERKSSVICSVFKPDGEQRQAPAAASGDSDDFPF